jgi:peroxiredoxin
MKKYVKVCIPIVIIIGLIYIGFLMVGIYNHKRYQAEKIMHIPAFEFKSTMGGMFTNTNLRKDMPTVFLYFNTECDFCQAEIQDIVSNIQKFNNIQLLFVSVEPVAKIIPFQISYKLEIYDNIVFLSDYRNTFSNIFDVTNTPSSLVYDKNGILVFKNNGAIKVDYMLKKMINK